jgi:hypothetical protein
VDVVIHCCRRVFGLDAGDPTLQPLEDRSEGKSITTAEEWFNVRRPQILSLFGNLLFGVVPEPESPLKVSFEIVKTDRQFLHGAATRRDVRIRFENAKGNAEMLILVFSPNRSGKAAPALLQLSFSNTRDNGHDADPNRPGFLRNGIPLGELLKRSFGYVVVSQGDLVRHNEVEFLNSSHGLFYREGQSFPKAYEWGVISAISWSASRALDYLQTDPDIDAKRGAILGHSKCGKAALWAAAQDQRFALAISAQSGHLGAALSRRKSDWLCRNAWKFANNEGDLPVDQRMLMACLAPRPLYLCSGVEDQWADPRGEYFGAYQTSAVYRLLGKKGLETETSPPVGTAAVKSDVGYHVREGGHSVEIFDWLRFLEFAEYHLKK